VVRPLMLVLEDLHWSDQATLALVAYLAQRRAPARLLLLGTYRPVEVIVHGHPLQALKTALTLHGQCVGVALGVVAAGARAGGAGGVGARRPGAAVPPAVVATLHRRTDGHPLFLCSSWTRCGGRVPSWRRRDAGCCRAGWRRSRPRCPRACGSSSRSSSTGS